MAGKLKVNIRVGRSSGSFDASTTQASQVFVDGVAQTLAEDKRATMVASVKDLRGRVTRAVENELLQAFKYMSQNLIGQSSGADRQGDDGYKTFSIREMSAAAIKEGAVPGARISNRDRSGTKRLDSKTFPGASNFIRWKNLSRSTVKRKEANHNKFFLHKGGLKGLFGSTFARALVKNTGAVSFSILEQGKGKRITAKTDEIPVVKLRMTMLPKVFRGDLPGLSSGRISDFDPSMRFERRLGIGGEMLEKLKGPSKKGFSKPEWHRPLMQPVFTYWTMFRLPRRVGAVLNNVLAFSTKGRNS